MKLHEVLEKLNGSDMWFRPVGWVAQAYAIRDGITALVPSAKGGQIGMTHYTCYLAGDWEIVSPDQVIGEIEEIMK